MFFIRSCYLCIYLKTTSSEAARPVLPCAYLLYRACSSRSHWSQPDTATPPQHRMHRGWRLQKDVCLVHTQARELGNDGEGSPAPGKHPSPLQLPAPLGLWWNQFLFNHLAMLSLVSRHFFTQYSASEVPQYGKATSIYRKDSKQ